MSSEWVETYKIPVIEAHLPRFLRDSLRTGQFAVAANLREAQLSVLPPDQNDPIAARAKYRGEWCRRVGHPPLVCATLPSDRTLLAPFLNGDREVWCSERNPALDGEACAAYFTRQDLEFEREWRNFRDAQIAALPKPDMRDRNLRRVDLVSSSLIGINFRNARMQGADLRRARMERAFLRSARMQGANLKFAQMHRADLKRARMEEAFLRGAQMEGVNLELARMPVVDLKRAQLQGANFSFSSLTGREDAQNSLDQTNLSRSINNGGMLRFVDLTDAEFDSATDFRNAFLDASVTMTGSFRTQMSSPCQWSDEKLGKTEFYGRWRGWVEAGPSSPSWSDISPKGFEDVTPISPPPGCAWKTGPMPGAVAE